MHKSHEQINLHFILLSVFFYSQQKFRSLSGLFSVCDKFGVEPNITRAYGCISFAKMTFYAF